MTGMDERHGVTWLAIAVAIIAGLTGIATAPWPDGKRAIVAAVYAPLFLISIPVQAIMAGCSAAASCL